VIKLPVPFVRLASSGVAPPSFLPAPSLRELHMPDVPGKPIPPDASHIFGEALILLVQWRGGAEEPTVILDGQLLRINTIFGRVADLRYQDNLPRPMLDLLLTYAGRDPIRQPELTALALTPTYETAARCLLRWFEEKFVPPPRR
jgi:hypothetical protein